MRSLIDQAIELLVTRRLPMLPSKGASKGACVKWKQYQERLPTVKELRKWEQNFNPERWGVVTGTLSGIVVVDFDGEAGRKLMEAWGVSPHVRTGSGGFHWYVKHPGWYVKTLNAQTSKNAWPWPGVDIRGDGGFADLLGRNANGPYERLRELVPDPFDSLPERVRTYLRNQRENRAPTPKPSVRTKSAMNGHERRVDAERLIRKALEMASGGGRNNSGIWLACQLRDSGYGIAEGEAAMRDFRSRVLETNAKGQREPYTEREMMASLRQAYSRPARDPWLRQETGPHDDNAAALSQRRQRTKNDAVARKENAPPSHDADASGSISLYVDHTGEPQVDHTGEPLRAWRYARVPWEVVCDGRLKPVDVGVYCLISGPTYQGATSSVGTRRIASCIHVSRRLVVESIHRLEECGHLRRHNPGRGKRETYFVTSEVFSQKQRAGIEEVVVSPDGHRRLAAVRKDQETAWTAGPTVLKRSDRTRGRR